MTRKKSIVREYVEAILIAIVLALLIRQFIVQAFKIPSGSMEPTLLVGDHLLVNKVLYRFRTPERGEIVVFKFPQDRETDFIKRVIALPGETVSLVGQELTIDGQAVADDHAVYSSGPGGRPEKGLRNFRVPRRGDIIELDGSHVELYRHLVANEIGERGSIVNGLLHIDGKEAKQYVVERDYVFVMGDNRDNSYDSRFWGPVDTRDVVGKAMFIYWSFDGPFYNVRWGRLADMIN